VSCARETADDVFVGLKIALRLIIPVI